MKILELRFKNLNSLYGKWFIDFTDPEYTTNGIFALTGPTGAGKSTILDAICLALYGATPRLGRITKGSNEIMSRRTGDCFAEVMFESQAGRFRCHWGQHRARKKTDGRLAEARHEITDAETGRPIETKKRLVPGVIEEKTGMDFDRFTRSMLLAQGGFDTFLKADVEEKSKILEQITGTEIYTEISRRVHERQRDEHEKLNLMQAETSGIFILEPEEERKILQDIEGNQKKETELAASTTEIGKAITWLSGVDGLKKEIRSLAEESERIQTEALSFKPDLERLSQALKAAEMDGDYATLTTIRKQHSADQACLKNEQGKLPGQEGLLKDNMEALKKAERQTYKAKEDMKEAALLIRKVRLLDQKLSEQGKAVETGETSCEKEARKIEDDRQLKRLGQDKRSKAEKELEEAEGYIDKHYRDEWLVGGLAGIEEQLKSLLLKQDEIAERVADEQKAVAALNKSCEKLDGCINQHDLRKQELEDAIRSLEQEKKGLNLILGGRLLREYRAEKETLLREMAFLARIAELEDYRKKLRDGKPCPLCGAKEHPFADNNIPVPDEIEKEIESLSGLIHKAEEKESLVKRLETAENEARKILANSERLEEIAAGEKKTAEKGLADIVSQIKGLKSQFESQKEKISQTVKDMGYEPDMDNPKKTIKDLRSKMSVWQTQVRKKAEIEKKVSDLDSELNRLDAVIETQRRSLKEKHETLDLIKKEYIAGSSKRQELFGSKSPDREEERLNRDVSDAEKAEKKARSLFDAVLQELNSTKTNITALTERIDNRVSELKMLEAGFVEALLSAGFNHEKGFSEARLGILERDRLMKKAKDLNDRQTDINARQNDRKDRLFIELNRKVTDKTKDELEPRLKALEEDLRQIRDVTAGLKHKLTENTAAKERMKEKKAKMEGQKKECRRWERLHGLIGSADGKKYRNFAQGLTFELMVSYANRQLEKMTDRYLLIRDHEQPLELNVIDNYQAGEIRSTRNLSGGESFIVSLALALGLSGMASRKVRVDSLFLDEGFATLDEDALETALETLSGLQQDGKLIGVISHVSALKERISTQITITAVSGGRSILSGPGCSRVAQDN